MSKYIIDMDAMTITPFNEVSDTETLGEQLYNLFSVHDGVKEYDGIVAEIQKWYYGRLVKASWCATALSYFANKVGIALHAENVNVLRVQCRQLANAGIGAYYDKKTLPAIIQKGDVLFWLWEGTGMTNTSSKHVGICAATTKNDIPILCIGGNQDNKICSKFYDNNKLYAVYRP